MTGEGQKARRPGIKKAPKLRKIIEVNNEIFIKRDPKANSRSAISLNRNMTLTKKIAVLNTMVRIFIIAFIRLIGTFYL